MKTVQQIASDIEGYIAQHGGNAREWYVGIAANARERLFSGHNVDENGDLWIYREAASHREARTVEDYFVKEVGTKGGPGGGDVTTRYVYAYRISSHTRE